MVPRPEKNCPPVRPPETCTSAKSTKRQLPHRMFQPLGLLATVALAAGSVQRSLNNDTQPSPRHTTVSPEPPHGGRVELRSGLQRMAALARRGSEKAKAHTDRAAVTSKRCLPRRPLVLEVTANPRKMVGSHRKPRASDKSKADSLNVRDNSCVSSHLVSE